MMRPSYNVLSPSNGEVILKPTQDMVIGCYYLTLMIKKNNPILHKWFSNETEALLAFYQKKITIHSSILVRYSLKNFIISLEDNRLKLSEKLSFAQQIEIILYKRFSLPLNKKKEYFITNIGILICHYSNDGTYKLTDLFLETTPGRLIFSINFKNLVKK
jgi:DNA-directed RNA polymerase beta' subunit